MSNLTQDFPELLHSSFRITSPETTAYNCIAWAAEDVQSWWWPDPNLQYYWPQNVPRVATLDAFIKAFATLGYSKCHDANYERDFTKIAIFINNFGIPTHAARLLHNGRWTSKCGSGEDIEHDLHALCGQLYGDVVCYMKKLNS